MSNYFTIVFYGGVDHNEYFDIVFNNGKTSKMISMQNKTKGNQCHSHRINLSKELTNE